MKINDPDEELIQLIGDKLDSLDNPFIMVVIKEKNKAFSLGNCEKFKGGYTEMANCLEALAQSLREIAAKEN